MTSFADRQGLHSERTALAWQRTAVLAAVALLPPLVVDVRIGAWGLTVGASLAAMVAAGIVVAVHRRLAQLLDDTVSYSPFVPMAGVAAVTALAAVSGLASGIGLLLT